MASMAPCRADHSHLDKQQRGWQRHQLPYKLRTTGRASLRPCGAANIDFAGSAESGGGCEGTAYTAEGRMDCLAIWVDYASGGNPDDGAFP